MIRFIAQRLAALVLTLLAASFLIFAVTEFSPGDVARKTLGPYALQEQVDGLYRRLHLNDPLPVRYVRWLGVLLGLIDDPLQDPALKLDFSDPRGKRYFGNFGYSTLYKAPVNGVVFTSIPEFASGVFFTAIFVVGLGWLPGTSPLNRNAGWSITAQLVLPVTVLVLYDSGYVARMVRGSMAEVMNKPFIRTAILKGLRRREVILHHAIRNAMIAPFTVILLQINFLISGVVVTEMVFAYPGFGRMLLEASLFGDIQLIEAATLIALTVAVSTQLISDIGYMLLNPQIRL